jgi:hypothetical protein
MRSIGVCYLLVAILLGWGARAQQVVDQRTFEEMKVGEVIRLDGVLKKPTETICVLQPYQGTLSGDEPVQRQVNAYLAASKYSSDEGHWALAFVEGGTVSVQRFKRSSRLDIATGDASLPSLSFKATTCAALARAGLWKGRNSSNRDVVVFGEVR